MSRYYYDGDLSPKCRTYVFWGKFLWSNSEWSHWLSKSCASTSEFLGIFSTWVWYTPLWSSYVFIETICWSWWSSSLFTVLSYHSPLGFCRRLYKASGRVIHRVKIGGLKNWVSSTTVDGNGWGSTSHCSDALSWQSLLGGEECAAALITSVWLQVSFTSRPVLVVLSRKIDQIVTHKTLLSSRNKMTEKISLSLSAIDIRLNME